VGRFLSCSPLWTDLDGLPSIPWVFKRATFIFDERPDLFLLRVLIRNINFWILTSYREQTYKRIYVYGYRIDHPVRQTINICLSKSRTLTEKSIYLAVLYCCLKDNSFNDNWESLILIRVKVKDMMYLLYHFFVWRTCFVNFYKFTPVCCLSWSGSDQAQKGRLVDALAIRGDEGRDTLR